MKAIIKGKRYNTDKAQLVAKYDNILGGSDFNYLCEKLYQTEKGNWFLAGEGGPMTKYARHVGNGNKSGGSKITPMTENDVIEWLEEHDHTEILEAYFPEHIDDA